MTDGTNTDATYAEQSGTYTIIGDTCHVDMRIKLSSLGSLSGALWITGLPFSASATYSSSLAVGYFVNGNLASAGMSLAARVAGSSIYLSVWASTSGTMSSLQHSNLTATTEIRIGGSYKIT